ncbi:LysR substrate-binding domain-containing protein [Novosphingobium terrae]|uniref:LysR substrate-binding domain-containing protein n=1 Tax=Novosphingobium terrae TaxID=2726189 RepID=UPI001981C56B|nr:LysR substrate-binding domain-containing protein [Novosphingobium terrae]
MGQSTSLFTFYGDPQRETSAPSRKTSATPHPATSGMPEVPYANIPSFPQLRAFASVAETRSVSRGASDLARSQPAVTQAIANLESWFGVPLFLRQRSGLFLTEAGMIVHHRVQRYVCDMRGALLEFGGERGWTSAHADALAGRLTRPLIVTLLLIDEFGSLVHAAKMLQQREATLRKAVGSLESELDAPIFDREPHGISTNQQGKQLASRMRLAMRELEAAREEVNAGFGVENGRILVGAMMLAGNHLLTSVLQSFTRAYPQAQVSVTNATYDMLLDRLKRGSIDFVVGLQNRPPATDNVLEQVIAADPFVLAVRRGHPLLAQEKVTRNDLAQYDWVLSAPGAIRRQAFEDLFAGMARPFGRVETHSLVTIMALLADSNAIAVLTRSELLLAEELGDRLAALDFGPLETESCVAMITRRGWLPTRLQTAFAHALRGLDREPGSLSPFESALLRG